jgi:hypothetical protein
MKRTYIVVAFILAASILNAQSGKSTPDTVKYAPDVLPGKGLAEHDFFYAGEGSVQNMYIVRKGAVVWQYTHPANGEISDAVLYSNDNILFAHQFGVTLINHDKKILWNYDAPPGTEIHTAQPIGKDRVVFIQNGKPAKLMVINIKTGKTEKDFELPVGNPERVHAQFRHARLTKDGTIMVAHLDMGKIAEYDVDGNMVWSLPFPGVWGAVPLEDGNILVTVEGKRKLYEITRNADTVWKFSGAEIPGIKFSGMQLATRLPNGNTIVNSWCRKGNGTPVQAVEVTPDKKFVWALRSWTEPADLGPSTVIQVLDRKTAPEKVRFGNIK